MKIALGCDHGGYDLMQTVKSVLDRNRYDYIDLGCEGERCDYSDFADKVTDSIQKGEADLGIVICGTGVGISISSNKKDGIRCALVSDCFTAQKTREHNDANMLAMGGRTLGKGLAEMIVETFLSTPFSNEERHLNRIKKMDPFYRPTPI